MGNSIHFSNSRACRVKNNKDLLEHMQATHSVEVNSTVHKFDSLAEFDLWKQAEEIASRSHFVTQRAAKISLTMKHIYYYCNRYGLGSCIYCLCMTCLMRLQSIRVTRRSLSDF